jgi:hypothetical protein
MMILTNDNTGIAVKIEADGIGGYVLTHVSFEPNSPITEEGEGNTLIEVKKFKGALAFERAKDYAELCVMDTIPGGTFMRVGY